MLKKYILFILRNSSCHIMVKCNNSGNFLTYFLLHIPSIIFRYFSVIWVNKYSVNVSNLPASDSANSIFHGRRNIYKERRSPGPRGKGWDTLENSWHGRETMHFPMHLNCPYYVRNNFCRSWITWKTTWLCT